MIFIGILGSGCCLKMIGNYRRSCKEYSSWVYG